MKKISTVIGLIATVLLVNSCANIYRVNKAELAVTPVSDMTSNTAKWQEIGKGIQNGQEYVFYIAKGQTIPIKLNLNTDYFRLNPGKNYLEFDRDMYLMISSSKLRISPDGESWADIYDMNSVKTLLGYNKGSLTLGFSASKESGPQITIELAAK